MVHRRAVRRGPPDRDRDHAAGAAARSRAPTPRCCSAALPELSPEIGDERLERSGPTIETHFGEGLDDPEYAIEVSYEGSYELDEATLADGSTLDDHFSAMGGWIASTLVRVGDLTFDFLPPIEDPPFSLDDT